MTEEVQTCLAATVLLARDSGMVLSCLWSCVTTRSICIRGDGFPRGSVDAADSDARLRDRIDGAEGLSDADLSVRVAAREAFEECGVLYARHAESGQCVRD